MPVRDDPTSTATFLGRTPPHNRMHGDVCSHGNRLQTVELLDDCVGGFASHSQNVRYSYRYGKRQCTKILTDLIFLLCENQTMADEVTEKYIEWIKEGLSQPGKTQSGLAKHLGIAHPQITQLLQGKRSLKVSEPPRIAEYLEMPDPFTLSAGTSDVRLSDKGLVPVPVVGKTEAGSFREVDDMDQSEPLFISLPRDDQFPNARQMVFDVEGDSMNNLKPFPIAPGSRAVCVAYEDIAHEATLRDGMVVIVERTRDGGHTREWSIKQVEIYQDRTEFHPRSNNPKHKPIVIKRDMHADDGTAVEIIALLRRVVNEYRF